jgi:outer membrane protein assembly factor BamB
MYRTCGLLFVVLAFLNCPLLAGDWLTFSGDTQRTGWARSETRLTRQNVDKLQLEWKAVITSPPKQMTGPTTPLVARGVSLGGGVRDLILIGGASDDVFILDASSGKELWHRHFSTRGTPRSPATWTCPSALNATPVVDKETDTVYLISSDGHLYSLNIADGEDRQPPLPFVPPFSKNWSLSLSGGVLYTSTSQGCSGAKSGIYSVDVRSHDRPVHFFQAADYGAGIWGRAGVAIDSSGHVLAPTGDGKFDPTHHQFANSIVALDGKTLELTDYYTPKNYSWLDHKDLDLGNSSAVVFRLGHQELIAAAAKEGVIYLLAASSLGGAGHETPLFRSPQYLNEGAHLQGHGFWGALSTWVDETGERWLFAPGWGPPTAEATFPMTNGTAPGGSIMAFRVKQAQGEPRLAPAWISRDMAVPEPVVVTNGVVFALSNGANEVLDHPTEGRILTGEERASNPVGNAVLYALNSETGKELYSSGKIIAGWTHFSGLALSDGHIYTVTHDGTIYAFGLPTLK